MYRRVRFTISGPRQKRSPCISWHKKIKTWRNAARDVPNWHNSVRQKKTFGTSCATWYQVYTLSFLNLTQLDTGTHTTWSFTYELCGSSCFQKFKQLNAFQWWPLVRHIFREILGSILCLPGGSLKLKISIITVRSLESPEFRTMHTYLHIPQLEIANVILVP